MPENDADFVDSAEEEYEVESIAAHKKAHRRVGVEYLIKWKGYDESDNTWEHETNVHAPELIEAYWADKGGQEGKEAARMGKRKQQAQQAIQRRRNETDTSKELDKPCDTHDDIGSSPGSSSKNDLTYPSEKSKKRPRILSSEEMEEDDRKEEDKTTEYKVEESSKDKEGRARPVTSLDNFLAQKALKEVNMDDIIFDPNYPPDSDSIDWEEKAASVEYMVCDPDNDAIVYVVLRWKNGELSMHERSLIHEKCPLLLLQYYEKRITFPGQDSSD